MSIKMKRAAYADMFAPATGDRVRLADTDLVVEVVISPSPVKRQSAWGQGRRQDRAVH